MDPFLNTEYCRGLSHKMSYTQYNKHPARFDQYRTEPTRPGAFLLSIQFLEQKTAQDCIKS